MDVDTPLLDAAGLRQFQALCSDAARHVADRFQRTHTSIYARFGERGHEACRDDLAFHLEFLRPVLEFGIVQPMVEYLHWLAGVLRARDIPAEHLTVSLDWLADFFAASAMAEEDARVIVAALKRVKGRFLESEAAPPAIYTLAPDAWAECAVFETALLDGDRRRAQAVFDACLARGESLVETEMHVVQAALYEIGRKWETNRVTVSQEHLATAIAQSVMTKGLLAAELPASNGRAVVLACVAGNQHCVGLQMVADAFQLGGWDVQYLGANVPTAALIQHVGHYPCDLLGLSVSFAQGLHVVREVIAGLRRAQGYARPSVIVGGLAINQFGRLASELGADGWGRDASSAVTEGLRHTTSRPATG
jgi:methanogenic corrinoid protein MtbC1